MEEHEELKNHFKEMYIQEIGFEPTEEELKDYVKDILEEEVDISNNDNDSPFNKVFGIIFLGWFIASLISLIYFSSVDERITLIIFGQYFLGFGIVALCCKQLIGSIFAIVGIGIIVIPILIRHPELIPITINWEFLLVFIFGFVFIIVGIGIIIGTFISKRNYKKRCTEFVYANIISILGDDNKFPIYQYKFNNKIYKVRGNNTKDINIGDTLGIMINPNKPREIYLKVNTIEIFWLTMISLGCIFSGLFVMIISYLNLL